MTESPVKLAALPSKDALRLCRETEDIPTILALTHHQDPVVRQRALKEICPCRVKEDIDQFWKRVLEMIDDPADNVREQVSVNDVTIRLDYTIYFLSLFLSGLAYTMRWFARPHGNGCSQCLGMFQSRFE